VVEQQLKKCCDDKLVLGWFSCLGFAASAGCVLKSVGKCGKVKKSVENVTKPIVLRVISLKANLGTSRCT